MKPIEKTFDKFKLISLVESFEDKEFEDVSLFKNSFKISKTAINSVINHINNISKIWPESLLNSFTYLIVPTVNGGVGFEFIEKKTRKRKIIIEFKSDNSKNVFLALDESDRVLKEFINLCDINT